MQVNNDQAEAVVPAPSRERVPRVAALLGAAGLLPVAGAVGWLLIGSHWSGGNLETPIMIEVGVLFYVLLIFNFIGGMWWGLASKSEGPALVYLAAVTPTLLTLLLIVPAASNPNGAALLPYATSAAILATLPIDVVLVKRSVAPAWWLRLRLPLSIGLAVGLSTVAYLVGGMNDPIYQTHAEVMPLSGR